MVLRQASNLSHGEKSLSNPTYNPEGLGFWGQRLGFGLGFKRLRV